MSVVLHEVSVLVFYKEILQNCVLCITTGTYNDSILDVKLQTLSYCLRGKDSS